LESATTAIVRVTTGAVGNVGGQVVGITERELVQLTVSLRQTIVILDGILDTVTALDEELGPEVLDAIERNGGWLAEVRTRVGKSKQGRRNTPEE
jgi:hypothetical protein